MFVTIPGRRYLAEVYLLYHRSPVKDEQTKQVEIHRVVLIKLKQTGYRF